METHREIAAAPTRPLEVAPGALYFAEALDRKAQEALARDIARVMAEAPLFVPRMPRTGTPFSVRMTNCGPLGWVSDAAGYRYQPFHPETRAPWPPMPPALLDIWSRFSGARVPPEACLVNVYGPGARMGLHQDKDEKDLTAPVLSISLGDSALFRVGGATRGGPTRSLALASGDVFVLSGESRLAFHGIDRILPGTSTVLRAAGLEEPGRINLTLRRVTPP